MKAEFNESDIGEGVSPWEYAKEHMDGIAEAQSLVE